MAFMKKIDLATSSPRRLFAAYFFPTLVGMLVESFYILVDGIFIGRGVGALGLGAVNLTWPVFSLFVCFAFLLGSGGATLYSIRLGEGRCDEANRIFSLTMMAVGLLIGTLSLLIWTHMSAFIRLLGAEGALVPPVRAYMVVLVPFFTPGLIGLVLFGFVRNDGNPRLAMIASVVPALLNVLLDYTFLFVFGWGMAGAALATGIGWCLSPLICLLHFLKKDHHLRWSFFRVRLPDLLPVMKLGFPPFLLEFSVGLSAYMLNLSLLRWTGEEGVMAFGIINSIAVQAVMAMFALTNALQPLISFNYGAGRGDRVRSFLKLGLATALGMGLLVFGLALGWGGWLAGFFAPGETALLALTHQGMEIYFASFVFCGANLVIATWYQARERSVTASTVIFLRGVGMVALGLVVLPRLLGATGVWWSIPFAEVTTLFVSVGLIFRDEHSLRSKVLRRGLTEGV